MKYTILCSAGSTKPLQACKQGFTSMSQSNYEFIEGPLRDWTIDESLYA